MLALIALTIVFWTISCLGIEVTLWAFGIDLPWYAPVVILAFLTLGLAIPSTPGNIGTFHYAASYAMTSLGASATTAGAFSVVSHAVSVLPFTLLAIPVFFAEYVQSNKAAKLESAERGPDAETAEKPGESEPATTTEEDPN